MQGKDALSLERRRKGRQIIGDVTSRSLLR